MADKDKKTTPVPAVATAPVVEHIKTEAELVADMSAAIKSGDYKVIAKVANDLVKFQKAKEQADLEAKQKVLLVKTDLVKTAIQKALAPLVAAGELDLADGIWYTQDFSEKLVTCKLMKTAAKASSGSHAGGGGKKFNISTDELMEKFGQDSYKNGTTFKVAYDSNTDKNWRYGIREALLKLNGNIQ